MPSYYCWTKHGERGVMMEDNEEEEEDDDGYPNFPEYDDTAEGNEDNEVEDQEAPDEPADDDLGRAIADARRECETEKERLAFDKMIEDHNKLLYATCEDGHKKLGSTLELLQWKAENGVTDSGFGKLLTIIKRKLPRVLIQGPKQPGNDIDVYLKPLVEELLQLWSLAGVRVWDEHKQEEFDLRALLFVTINDWPALGNISGQSNKGYNACTHCLHELEGDYLEICKKVVYLGHHRFLRLTHPVRKKGKHYNGEADHRRKPPHRDGVDIFGMVKDLDVIFGKGPGGRFAKLLDETIGSASPRSRTSASSKRHHEARRGALRYHGHHRALPPGFLRFKKRSQLPEHDGELDMLTTSVLGHAAYRSLHGLVSFLCTRCDDRLSEHDIVRRLLDADADLHAVAPDAERRGHRP
ncbi:hypothetical protein QYE76_002932 [Lolium multiflorum]|uniref:Uncharacterized protein n=1 Tax=Lolium multiflorum TaxID=4521 RepID=A0AAD8RQL1_LOLMU|nr:hypothetical protein QYE76_002932 [Lolium multiflorum]